MDAKRFVVGTVVGAITVYLVGWVIFDWIFSGFYRANAGLATGVDRGATIWWAMVVAELGYGALIVYALGRRPAPKSIVEGTRVGAVVGFLLWLTVDFIFYASTNLSLFPVTIVDPLLEAVHGGIAGAVIAAVLMKVPVSAPEKAFTAPGV